MNERRRNLIDAYHANKLPDVEVLLDNVWDRHNVGAILRSMDGFGIPRAYLWYTYNEEPEKPRLKPRKPGRHAGAGATRWVRWEHVRDLQAYVAERKALGYRIIGADLNDRAYDLVGYRFPVRCVLVMGAETEGLSPEVRALIDDYVFVPMVGMIGSYNVSVAASIIMYEVYRQLGGKLKLRQELGILGRP